MMLALFYLQFIFVYVNAFNLVIDTNGRMVNKFVDELPAYYLNHLDGSEFPKIQNKRRFGTIAIEHMVLRKVEVEWIHVEMGQSLNIEIRHLHAELSGAFTNKLFVLKHEGHFNVRIRDLNATLGPITLKNTDGLPFVRPEIHCHLRHHEDKVHVTESHWTNIITKYRLWDTMRKDLKDLICDQLANLLKSFLEENLRRLRINRRLKTGDLMLYTLEYDPAPLKHATIRTFHKGIRNSSAVRLSDAFTPYATRIDTDFVFYIYEGLLAEGLTSICRNGFLDEIFTIDGMESAKKLTLKCNGDVTVSLANYSETTHAEAIFPFDWKLYSNGDVVRSEDNVPKKVMIRLLYNSKFEVLVRVVAEGTPDEREPERMYFSNQVIKHISEMVKLYGVIPLPQVKGLNLTSVSAGFDTNRIILAANLEN